MDRSKEAEELFDDLQVWKYEDFSFEKIGEGFFGTVFKVIHQITSQVLVLKELKSSSDEYHKSMFMEEIKTLSRLCHPNVLKCEGFALHEDNICLVTEYIDGGSLEELLVRRSLLLSSWETRLAVAIEISLGMTYLHSAKVIHRDLASKNILIRTKSDGRLQAIVADLGLSHTVSGHSLSEEEYDLETVGSPYHMAPEVLCHKPYNMKADVFSYGIILCEMIIMRPGGDPDDVPRSNDFGLAVADFSEIASDCPSKLLDLTVRCCQVDPKQRPNFSCIVKALDMILDKVIDSDDEAQLKPDYMIEDSLICTCPCEHDTDIDEDLIGMTDSKDRFGSVRKIASRRLVKRHLQRCRRCGGRILKATLPDNTDKPFADVNVDYRNGDASSVKHDEIATANDFIATNILNVSEDKLTEQLNELAENTPGKLPRLFQNIFRSKFGKIRPKDVKRRWRKSLHDIFSSQHHQDVNSVTAVKTLGSPTDEPSNNWEVHKCTANYKSEKRRRGSRVRSKSALHYVLQNDKTVSGNTSHTNETEQKINGQQIDPHCLDKSPLSGCPPLLGQFIAKSVTGSVDSLDKLGVSEDSKERNIYSRRNSMPIRKNHPDRTKSSDAPQRPPPPLRKQSSGTSKLLNFLRRRAQTSPRD